MNTSVFDRWLLGAGGLIALLVVSAVLNYRNTEELHHDGYWVAHTHEVMDTLEEVAGHLREAQAVQRTYLILGGDAVPPDFAASIDAARQKVRKVRELTADNGEQQARILGIATRVEDLAASWSDVMRLRREEGFDAARKIVAAGQSGNVMLDLLGRLREMDDAERRLLAERQRQRENTYNSARFTGLLAGVLGVAGIVAFMVLLRRHLGARRQAAALIAEQGERLRTTLASIGDAVMATDPAGRITMMNGVAETLTGWKADEAAGQPLEAVFRIVNEETRRSVENPATRALREGVIVGLANHTVLIDKGGAERAIDDSAAPIRCKEGEVVGCVLVFRDVTEQRRDEANLRRQASLLEQSYDAIFVWEFRGRIVYWNKAAEELYGYTREEAVGRVSHELLATVFSQQDAAAFLAALERQGQSKGELVHTRKDGERVTVESRIRLMTQEDGRRLVLETCRDMTERKAAEEEQRRLLAALSEADRRKDEFLAMLAHELRNPLAPIRNGLQILRLSDDRGVGERALAMMERQLAQLVHLVDDLMDVSRITRDKLELRMERAPLAAALDSAVEASRPLIDRMGHELTIMRPPDPIYLDADMTRLTQVFANLLTNAAKYTERGGRIWLTAERQGSDAVVSVRDNGIGIDPGLMPHIFGMFMQVDRSLERAQGGLGIGLTLVKRLVEMHGGTIDVRSEGPGRGSEFIVRLPIVVEASVPPPAERAQPAAPRSSFRILVVDDNRDGADSLATMLRIMGNDTRTAYDGEQALDAAEEFRPDVALLDIGLPKLNGYEACRRIRERPWGKGVVLIALTGWGQDEDRRRSRESGFDHHMIKPVDPLDLMKLLADLHGVRS